MDSSDGSGMAAAGGEIPDATLQKAFRRVVQLDRRSRQWKLAHGWKVCPVCRTVHNLNSELCCFCRETKNGDQKAALRKLLQELPWADYQRAQAAVPRLTEDVYALVKRSIIVNLEEQIRVRINRGLLPEEIGLLREEILTLAMLRTGREPGLLDAETAVCAVGGDYFAWLRH